MFATPVSMRRAGSSEGVTSAEPADGDLVMLYDPKRLQVRANVPIA